MKIIYYFLNYVSFLPHQLQYVHLQNKSNTQEYKQRLSHSINKPHNRTNQLERWSLGLELSDATSEINGVRELYSNEMVYECIPEDAAVGWDPTRQLTPKLAQARHSSQV